LLDVLHLIHPSRDDVTRAVMAGEGGDEETTAHGGLSLAGRGEERIHLGVDRSAEFNQSSDSGFAQQLPELLALLSLHFSQLWNVLEQVVDD
jgi:hypothetical protein